VNTEERIEALEMQIATMDKQLERISAEMLGFRAAFIHLCPFLPISARGVTRARELAIALVEDAMPPDETPHDTSLIALESVHKVFAMAGIAHRPDTDGPNP